MNKKRHTPEQIIKKIRAIELLGGQGRTMAEARVLGNEQRGTTMRIDRIRRWAGKAQWSMRPIFRFRSGLHPSLHRTMEVKTQNQISHDTVGTKNGVTPFEQPNASFMLIWN